MCPPADHVKHTPLIKPVRSESVPSLAGLVLAGGESRRMGTDKSLLDYHGIPQRDFILSLMSEYVSSIYLSCHPQRIPETKHPVLKDTFLDLGPFGGVLSAFRFNPNVAWLVAACDIPLLDDATLQALLHQRDPANVATCFTDPATGLPEPLITIWEPRAYPILLQSLSEGNSCLRNVLINTGSKQIQVDNPSILRNANTPEEVIQIKDMINTRKK